MDLLNASNDSEESDEDYVPDQKEHDNSIDTDSDNDISDEDNAKSRKKFKASHEPEETPVDPEEKKKQDDDIWADFMKDTGFRPKNSKIENKTATVKTAASTKPTAPTINTRCEKKDLSNIASSPNLVTKPTVNAKSSGGLSGVLSNLGKKSKLSTLEKSKLDWDRFKKEENLEEDLKTHNKGKDGYLERQDFLNRADLRRFEIEKKLRTIERNKRDMGM